MTIQSDKNIANTYKTVRKWTVSKLKQLESTTKQIELCEFEWWYELEKAFIYAGCKQICLSTGNDLATFRVSLTK